jgi:hypothetical protein
MRGTTILFLAALGALALSGCASTGTAGNAGKSPPGTSKFDENADYELMAIMTQDAMLRGNRVVWVHPPEKKNRLDVHKYR